MASELDPLSPLLLNGEIPDGWSRRRLGEVAAISGGTTPSRADDRYWGGSAQWATPTDLTSRPAGLLEISTTAEALTPAAVEETSVRVLPVNSVLMTSRATIGEVAINAVPMATNQGFCNFIPKQHTDPIFLAHWLAGNKKRLERLAGGSTFLELAKRDAREVRIHLPPLPEQRKIAAILSSVDDAITTTRKVIEQTKRVKQGLLQTLMTRGIGHTQFKNTEIGEIPEAWKLVPLPACEEGGLLELGRGQVISAKDIEAVPGDYPVYSSSAKNNGEMGRYGRWMFDEELITWSIDGGGDLFYRPKHRFSVTNVGGYLRLLSSDLSYRFVHAALVRQHQKIRFDYQSKAHPSVIRTWYHIPIAPIEEQRKIERNLNALDATLERQSSLVQEWRHIKRGLMQDLLTGRVRVQPD